MSRPAGAPARHLRCRRCASRKFRTQRDLAEHILYKHGRVTVYSEERARAPRVTFCEDSPSWSTSVAPHALAFRRRARPQARMRKRMAAREAARGRREAAMSERLAGQLAAVTTTANKRVARTVVCQTVCTKPVEAVLAAVPNRPAVMLDFTQAIF